VRALVVGPAAAWSVADVFRGWCRGLAENGVEVVPYVLSDRLLYYRNAVMLNDDGSVAKKMTGDESRAAASLHILALAYRYDPDVVFIVHGAHADWGVLSELRCRKVMLLTESPYEDEPQALMCQQVEPDLILINDPTHQGVFDQIAPTFYVPHAYDPTVHYPGTGVIDHDCVFVGTGFQNRIDWLERVDWSGIDLVLAGEWSLLEGHDLARFVSHQDDLQFCMSNDDTAELYRRSATGFNVYRYETNGEHSVGDGWAIGPREVEAAACGMWMARQARAEGDELFPMLPTFTDPGELGDLIRWALAHPDERKRAAEAAAAAVADRTFANHAKRALARLNP
jgi:spore maturation protein CgeB